MCRQVNGFTLALLFGLVAGSVSAEPASFDALKLEYERVIRPLLEQSCLRCHNDERQEADLDLERFSNSKGFRQEPRVWQKALFMLENNEMPPKKSKQLAAEQKATLIAWIHQYLAAEAHAGAGDPGRVVLRRLSNAEYDNTIRDLTSVDLKPTREFPADSAAGEGFTNAGESMVMSPALLDKYLDAAREIASHVVFLPDGFRFSRSTARRDQTDEVLDKIREIHELDSEGQHVQLSGSPAGQVWSRLNLRPYFRALLQDRDRLRKDPSCARAIARERELNAVYLRHLSDLLVNDKATALLARVRARVLAPEANPELAEKIVAEIELAMEHLWDMKTVSQRYETGLFARDRTVDQQEIRVAMPAEATQPSTSLSLVTGDSGDGNADDLVIWENPRFEQQGRPPIRLRDLRPLVRHLDVLKKKTFTRTKDYLEAVAVLWRDGSVDLESLAADRNLDTDVLRGWLLHLNVRLELHNIPEGRVEVADHMLGKQEKVGGEDLVNGRIHPEGNPSIVVNAMFDKAWEMLPARTASIHPSPSRYGAVGWRSPVDGVVQVEVSLIDAMPGCGNGVSWAVNLAQGPGEQSLASGVIDRGGRAAPPLIERVKVRKGDLIALCVGARDGDHSCDATRINLIITETANQLRSWDMTSDVIDDILVANPYADQYGHEDVWHIYTGSVGSRVELGRSPEGKLPADSVLNRWRTAMVENNFAEAERLGVEVTKLLTGASDQNLSPADREARIKTLNLTSPLFRHLDYDAMVKEEEASASDRESEVYGLPTDAFDAHGNLVCRAPHSVTINLPSDLLAGRGFMVTARLAPTAGGGSAQVRATLGPPAKFDGPAIDHLFLTREGATGHERAEKALEDFRELFPRYLCCRTTVPVDEGVTLVMYHREDSHLNRLMLTEAQRVRLERLWEEVRYISHDAVKVHEYFPLIMAFSTQVGHEYRYVHLEEPIRKSAEDFKQHLRDTEPAHLDALIEFASRAFRRPLKELEEWTLRAMYALLRADGEAHEDAFGAVLARVLAAPAFLYRIEEPGPGDDDVPVTNWELATRLSYFLWSTLPDDELLATAEAPTFVEPAGLREEALRMLKDRRVRGLATEFACQWLGVRNFDVLNEKNERQYPTFADLRDDMYEETILFFEDLFRRDGSVLEILDADHTFVNGALAGHYGIDGVNDEEWRRVEGMKLKSRGGVLGMAAVLAKNSGATRTSPVLRGFWVVETLLGEELPDPPATVPELPDSLSREGLTVRQMTERHVSDESCSGCHVRIDPYGFALECFDAIGRFRTRDLIDQPVDTQVRLRDGTQFDGVEGLRSYLQESRRQDFLQQFSRKLLGFAIGRAVKLSDQPLIEEIVKKLGESNFRVSAAIEAIVTSRQFRFHRGLEATREDPL